MFAHKYSLRQGKARQGTICTKSFWVFAHFCRSVFARAFFPLAQGLKKLGNIFEGAISVERFSNQDPGVRRWKS